jgi:hypothetical protein
MALRERAHAPRRPRHASLARINVVLAIAAVTLLATALLYGHSRGSPVFVIELGLPLFLAQLAFGLLPAAFCVSRERLTGAARLRLLVPAIGGPLATVSACVLSWLTGSMC